MALELRRRSDPTEGMESRAGTTLSTSSVQFAELATCETNRKRVGENPAEQGKGTASARLSEEKLGLCLDLLAI